MRLFSRILTWGRRSSKARRVPGFDGSWYSRAYLDVEGAIERSEVVDPWDHYRRVGAAQGRNPNGLFSEKLYRQFYPDVDAAIIGGVFQTAFEHFVWDGESEGRFSNPMPVDEVWYCEQHPEVVEMLERGDFAAASDHYRLEGCLKGWDPHAAFSEHWYLRAHPEVSRAVEREQFSCGYQHLLEEGLRSGLRPHPLFDEADYRSAHSDVDRMIRRGEIESGYRHLIEEGLRQGRKWRQISDEEKLRRAAERLAGFQLDDFLASDRRIDLRPKGAPEVSVLLVLFNRAELTLACLRSLVLEREVDFELVIVDNASKDRTGELLARLDGVRILRNEKNVGFTVAANQAAEAASSPVLLFLNNDAKVLPSSLGAALRRLQSCNDIGAVGGRILRLDGFLQEAGCLVWDDGRTAAYGGGEDPESGAVLFPREVDYCSGVFLMVSAGIFRELGGFDIGFAPAYYEDVDFCFRLRQRGLSVLFEPAVQVIHFGSASSELDHSFDQLLERNRKRFVELHNEELEDAFSEHPGNLVAASRRGECSGRVLWIDDRAPLAKYGSGCPRTREILSVLFELGYWVTFFCTSGERVNRKEMQDQLRLEEIEFITDHGLDGLADFWKMRSASTDIIIISRPHNLIAIQEQGLDFDGKPVIYDAEVLVSDRVARRREVLGCDDERDVGISRQEELAMASRADQVWVVSEKDAQAFAEEGQHVSVVGFALPVVPEGPTFEERNGLLFVGRLQEAWSPNVDGLDWFLREVYPRICENLGEGVPMNIVGELGAVDLPHPEGVRFLGAVDDLSELYRMSRVFVAPARFSAGLPWKVCEAAAHGLPVVASSDLVEQLGWVDGSEILDGGSNDPAVFADHVIQLLRQQVLWNTVKDRTTGRVREVFSRDRLHSVIAGSLTRYRSEETRRDG